MSTEAYSPLVWFIGAIYNRMPVVEEAHTQFFQRVFCKQENDQSIQKAGEWLIGTFFLGKPVHSVVPRSMEALNPPF